MVDLQVSVYFGHTHQCYFHDLISVEIGQPLFSIKNPHLQVEEVNFSVNPKISVYVNGPWKYQITPNYTKLHQINPKIMVNMYYVILF